MDVQLGHAFANVAHDDHILKPQSLRHLENAKRAKYTDSYRVQVRGFAFAPLVTNSWGVFSPDVTRAASQVRRARFLRAEADHAARNALSLSLRVEPSSSSSHSSSS